MKLYKFLKNLVFVCLLFASFRTFLLFFLSIAILFGHEIYTYVMSTSNMCISIYIHQMYTVRMHILYAWLGVAWQLFERTTKRREHPSTYVSDWIHEERKERRTRDFLSLRMKIL